MTKQAAYAARAASDASAQTLAAQLASRDAEVAELGRQLGEASRRACELEMELAAAKASWAAREHSRLNRVTVLRLPKDLVFFGACLQSPRSIDQGAFLSFSHPTRLLRISPLLEQLRLLS